MNSKYVYIKFLGVANHLFCTLNIGQGIKLTCLAQDATLNDLNV